LRISPKNELSAIIILSVLLIIIIVFLESNVLRIILGLPFLLFSPGYTLTAALFPRKGDLEGITRIALSFALSVAVVPLIGLILNYTPWGIALYPVLVSTTIFIVSASGAAMYRRQKISGDERFSLSFTINLQQWKAANNWDRVLSVFLIVCLLGAVGTFVYASTNPLVGERFTEFYILGPGGNATDYPEELTVGEKGTVRLGIVNQEHEDDVVYHVEILIHSELDNTIGPLVLDHEEKWEEEASFVPQKAGEDQKVEFILYRHVKEEPYQSLHLWLDVQEAA